MFLCHWHKHQVKGHGGEDGTPRALGSTWAVVRGYLHKEFLMVLHHAAMVLVCFPLSVVSPSSWGQEAQGWEVRSRSCPACQHSRVGVSGGRTWGELGASGAEFLPGS